ncbi:Histone-lysine N-methyltransferase [Wickerhamomyces ciferrii]|uniref:Histone-lysine N-methyltransferase, H3 lysine-36 specific n=1 Tax=Wickerhamomyces ciferrii (strain ATCC 14091 / BCRC 22168 / CBS 111 / JCM 3599 / NBRC 0793 / NRRL Y-1031 F-60-10) TaxID=1206466 RepID=K0KBP4_WICCF|nr:Histone-lysine N-methyltransferase [Wickerhamomyces ciferrii]CCH42475.1 Histone-lysine N-methyltransferase [Wickerhamomyces ciferrii]
MSEKQDVFSSDEEDYEPEFKSEGNQDESKFEYEEEQEDYEEEEVPKFSESDKLESQKKLNEKIKIKQIIPNDIKLFLDLKDKTDEALSTFINLENSTYANKQLGSSGQGEFMSCECHPDWDESNELNYACIDDDCINRGTKIECINGVSSCGEDCSNQRFQKKQYVDINVIQTEKKGYGVRSQIDIEPDTFIYEYIGEVIDEKSFKKRMLEYDELNFKHFYFMMLQKGEFLDATRKGSLARFCNHSCNPNCYVEKWVVGEKLKMGIFAKRKILKGEEITFDYNVDRYGANAQPCYCGEPNCIGFIGGKTQTEAASLLPQFISEALGSTIEDEQNFLKEKQEANEKIIKNDNNMNIEFINSLIMKPIDIFEVNKVMGVLLQCEEVLIAEKLIERIELSTLNALQYKLSYAHGYTSLGRILKNFYGQDGNQQFKIDNELVLRILKILSNWPKVSKNYINKVEIIPIVKELISNTKDKEIISLSNDLLNRWDSFEEFQRIRKKSTNEKIANKFVFDSRRQHLKELSPQRSTSNTTTTSQQFKPHDYNTQNTSFNNRPQFPQAYNELPQGWKSTKDPNSGKIYYYEEETGKVQWERPGREKFEQERKERDEYIRKKEKQERDYQKRNLEKLKEQEKIAQSNSLAKIIANAKKIEEEKLAREAELIKQEELKKLKKEEYKRKLAAKKHHHHNHGSTHSSSTSTPISSSQGSDSFEKKWSKFFANHIPNMLKKYRDEIGHDNIKLCAKDIVKILIEKEFKKHGDKPISPPLDLSIEKRKKIKIFIESYMEKFLIKYRSKHQKRKLENDETNQNGGAKKIHP